METRPRSPELTEDHHFENALLVDSVEVLRRRQADATNEESITDAEKTAKIEQLIEEYLDIFKEGSDSDKIDQLREKLRTLSVDKIDDFKWRYGEWADSSKTKVGPLGVDHVYKAQEELFGRVIEYNFDTDDDPEPSDADKEEERRVEKLEQLKVAKHKAYVKRMTGRRYGPKAKANREAYDQAEAAYSAALEEDLAIQLNEKLVADIGEDQFDEEVKDLAKQYLKDDNDEQYALLMEKGGVFARGLARYDKLSRRKKIGAGILLAGAGIGVGFAAGAAGAATAAVVGGLAGWRYGYNNLLGKAGIYKKVEPGSGEAFAYDSDSSDSAQAQIIKAMNLQSRANIERADEIKGQAVKSGMAAAAMGGLFGLAGGAAGAFLHTSEIPTPGSMPNIGMNDGHWKYGFLEHDWNGSDVATDVTETSSDGFVEGSQGGTLFNSVDDASLYPVAEPTIEQPAVATPAPADADIQLAKDGDMFTAEQTQLEIPTYTVASGESWTTAMTNLGVEPDHIPELLKDLGPQLEEMGVAYPMEYLWGISEAGELPHEATELIMTTAQENGWLNDATLEHGMELPIVPDGGGMNEFVNTNYDHTLSHEESLGLGEHLESNSDTADFLYQSDYLLDNFDNPYGISEPGMINPAVDEAIREYVGGLDGAEYQVGTSGADVGLEIGMSEPAGITSADISAELGQAEIVAETEVAPEPEQPAVAEQSVESDNVYTTDDTGVDVDDESLSPTPEVEVTELTDYQQQVLQSTLGGEFSNLNNLNVLFPQLATEYRFSDLAAALQGETFTDGTPVVESGTGLFSSGPRFNDLPDGAQLEPSTLETINNHLSSVGLGEYQLNQTSAGLQVGA